MNAVTSDRLEIEPPERAAMDGEVKRPVLRRASQILFRAWLFKIARNALRRSEQAGAPVFEFLEWMAFLDLPERDILTLRFIEQWDPHAGPEGQI